MLLKRVRKRIPPDAYNRAYLFSDYLEGYEEYKAGSLSFIKSKMLDMLALEEGDNYLELGLGRGEFIRHCAERGARVKGIDYSRDVVEVSREALREFPDADIRLAECNDIPFESDSFERVFAGDVIEHLCYKDALLMLREMYRVLKPGGFMLIHTAPNTLFVKWVYPVTRHFLKLINKDVVETIDYQLKVGRRLHIYEYNLLTLRGIAKRAGLGRAEVWMDGDILRSGKHRFTQDLNRNPLVRFTGLCGRFSLIRFFLGNDLYLKCYKGDAGLLSD